MNLEHPSRIVRTELLAEWRRLWGDDSVFGVALVLMALAVVGTVAGAVVAFSLGSNLRPETVVRGKSLVANLSVALFGLSSLLTASRVLRRGPEPNVGTETLLATPHRTVVLCSILVEYSRLIAMFGVPAVVCGLAFAAGVPSVTMGLLTLFVFTVPIAIGSCFGFAFAQVIQLLLARYPLLQRFKLPIVLAMVLLYSALSVALDDIGSVRPLVQLASESPFRFFSDLYFAAIVWPDAPIRVGLSALAALVVLLLLFSANVVLANWLWYSPVRRNNRRIHSLSEIAIPWTTPRTSSIITKTWIRAVRSPMRLAYVWALSFIVVVPATKALIDGDVSSLLALLSALYGGWAAGAAFLLNPLGEEGRLLPVTLTTPISGHEYLRGLWIASSVPAMLVTGIATAILAVASGLDVERTVLLTTIGFCLPALTPALAAGIGMFLPNEEELNVFGGRTAVTASQSAFTLYSICYSLLTFIPLTTTDSISPLLLNTFVWASPTLVGIVRGVIILVIVAIPSLLSYGIAVRRFESHQVE